MGYTTDFQGGFALNPQPTQEQTDYINTFSGTRRMKRDPEKLMEMYKGKHGLNGQYGKDGEYFCKDDGQCGQSDDGTIVNYNSAPGQDNWESGGWEDRQPGLWCQWMIEDGQLVWDEVEKFYEYTDWLRYMIHHFFTPWGIEVKGEVKWQGEDVDDRGIITVTNNEVTSETLV